MGAVALGTLAQAICCAKRYSPPVSNRTVRSVAVGISVSSQRSYEVGVVVNKEGVRQSAQLLATIGCR